MWDRENTKILCKSITPTMIDHRHGSREKSEEKTPGRGGGDIYIYIYIGWINMQINLIIIIT